MRRLAAYSFLWFAAGYTVGLAANAITTLPIAAWQSGVAGLLLGLVGLASVTRTEHGRRIFYEGPAENEEGIFDIGCLWAVPGVVLIISLVAWVVFSV